jgi:hypothetical protein
MGSMLLNTSHAAELPASSTQVSVAAPATQLPTSAMSGCCNVRVNKVSRPADNPGRVTLNITTTNTLRSILQISPGLQMTLQDTGGKSYNYTAAYLPSGASVGGPLAAGAVRSENIDFEIPENTIAQSLTFQLDASTTPLVVGLPL